jgi:hypothetical protein
MAEIEDPVTTLVRLLDTNIQVVKDDSSLADICVTTEWYDRELLKNYDAQVTVGLDHSEDQKLGFSTTLRRRVGIARVKIWVVDKPGSAGKQIRNKLRQEVNRVVREKRTKPNETNYNYTGVGAESVSHKAYYAESASELAPDAPEWTEFSAADYEKIWQSDNTRFSYSQSEAGKYSLLSTTILQFVANAAIAPNAASQGTRTTPITPTVAGISSRTVPFSFFTIILVTLPS